MKSFNFINQAGTNILKNLFLGICLIFLQVIVANAQSAPSGTTPAGIAPGSPTGSYSLSGFETINPYSGNLNFSLPLLQATGRGGMNIPVHLTVNQKWIVKRDANDYGGTNYYYVEDNWWNEWFTKDKGYGPGRLVGRRTGHGGGECPGIGWSYYNPSLTRLTFTTPDGTEHELLDRDHEGQPLNTGYCSPGPHGPSRGKIFLTVDGSSATFISDDIIYDNLWANEEERLYPSGYLMTKDGTRYRIDFGKVSWQRDRNGNKFTFTYESGGDMARIIKITDSLNREINFEYGVQDIAPYGLCDRITYKGFGGTSRTIRISYKPLGDVLRSGYSLQTGRQLFPYIYHSPSPPGSLIEQLADSQHNPQKVAAVWLPNDQALPDAVRSYQLRYNSYGELERVELPTGGVIEYKWEDARTLGSGRVSGFDNFQDDDVYRRVTERRIYANGTLENKKTLGGPEWLTDMRGYVLEDQYGADGGLLSRVKHYYYGIYQRTAAPVANNSFQFYQAWRDGQEYQTDLYKDASTVLRSIEYTWAQTAPSWYSGPPDHAPANNARLTASTTTLVDTNQISKQTYEYDQYNNQTDVYEYDFGDGAPGAVLRRTHTDYLTIHPVNGADYASNVITFSSIHIRNLPTEQSVLEPNGAAWITRARTTFEYDNYAPDTRHASLIPRLKISGLCTRFTVSGQCIETVNDDPTTYQTRGGVTGTTSYLLDTSGAVTGSISAYMQYDIAGNVVRSIDARGNITAIDFEDKFGAPDGEARAHAAPSSLASLDQKSYALATKVTNALGHSTYSQYDYYLGRVVDGEDVNGVISSAFYNDALDRPRQIIRAVNDSLLKNQTTFGYDDAARTVTSTTDKDQYNDNLLRSETVYDVLGRTIETRIYEGPTNFIATIQEYDALGRVKRSSNPYRANDAVVWTTPSYDALGRVIKVMTPGGSEVNTYYSGTQVLVKDQAGKERMSQTNGLGQLTDVWEITAADEATEAITFPNRPEVAAGYRTKYKYDSLGNLITATQQKGTTGTQQIRTFTYNSLSQLRTALNPESGVISYQYDDNGNLTQKTDARNIITTYGYDELNRLTSRTYQNDGGVTPSVYYKYDSQSLPNSAPTFDRGPSVGRLVAVLYGDANSTRGNYQGYDALGRVKRSIQRTNNGQSDQTYTFLNYDYDRAGNLTSQTYPSGKVIVTEYDNAGRIAGVKQQGGGYYIGASPDDPNDPNRTLYTAHGAVQDLRLGNGLWEHTEFNSRLQPIEIRLGTTQGGVDRLKLEYEYGTTSNNNGNVRSQTITVPTIGSAQGFTVKQTYEYDALNRLSWAEELNSATQVWKQSYSYDRFGNRRFNQAQTTLPFIDTSNQNVTNPAISEANNQLSGAGYSYDAAGNLRCDPAHPCAPTTNAAYYEYDAENKMVKNSGGANPNDPLSATYFYDGDGKRVKKVTGSDTTIFVYNAAGQLVAEYSTSTPAPGSGGTTYLTADSLGTPRVITDAGGNIKARHDYLPFGEEIAGPVGGRTASQGFVVDNVRQKFTQYERDVETGLDFAQARYYGSRLGRFTSVDPLIWSAKSDLPQSWNRYAYCVNNPLAYVDPTGLDFIRRTRDGRDEHQWLTGKQLEDALADKEAGWSLVQFDDNGRYQFDAIDADGNRLGRYELRADGTHDWVNEGNSGISALDAPTGFIPPTTGLRLPFTDFYTLQINVAIPNPYTATLVGVSGQLTLDRYGNVYVTPGAGVGLSATGVSGSFTGATLFQTRAPTELELHNLLTEHSVSIGGGFGPGGNFVWSPGNGVAGQAGIYSPQVGVNYGYGFRLGNPFRFFGVQPR